MRRLLQKIFRRPITWLALKFSSNPKKAEVFSSLDALLEKIISGKTGYPAPVPFDMQNGKFIIFSDQHKGAKDSADDFRNSEKNYMCALQHYYDNGFTFINLAIAKNYGSRPPRK